MFDVNYEEFEKYEEESEEDLRTVPDTFSEAVIWGTDWTVETINSQLSKGNIDLNPKFQRRDAWNDMNKSRLVESLMLGIPVPPIILAEKKDNKGKYIVIDGKQRLLAIRQFCAKKESGFNKLKLRSLQFLTELNGKIIEQIEDDYSYVDYKNQFENQTIRTVVIKNWPNEEFLFTVFLRLNTGSKKLSPQELRQALHPGPFLDFLDDATANSQTFWELLNNNEPDSRMRDVELALRFYAFKHNLEKNEGNLKLFLDDTCLLLNENWEKKEGEIKENFRDLENAINLCIDIFGKSAFSRFDGNKYNNRFNRPLFEVFTFYLSNKEIYNCIKKNKEGFKKDFENISTIDSEFNESISSSTKGLSKVRFRFNKIADIISTFTDFPVLKLVKSDNRLSIMMEE
ncbi:DUF262 domain-containing protein [Bacillus velezensis]|uniref:DUF262 domain-containing protein n=1 Tax=Bacillus amyloliquefaciens group TaxID=1938374 RepID=UPI001A9997CF|nr:MULTISPECIES: DUF262 domain-containing protein [Bacillus amyloliquefaciens group]UXZ17899.1 DUF262 domain-containing protein [Bacillus siamensis]MBY6039711.1 DUF262 domain-containing protein [Bacillus velezensis]MCA1238970.1 DUF262 domain-containing protein [Bacillus velezensis]QSZ46672.1 DUF262 domain-containing protein [Bacillus amyloliquefaciens]WFR92063.1 DUF262 domain-containing protein [Bacillus velezensis]